MSNISCPLCQSPAPEPVYQPDGTKRGAVVHLCKNCACLFSVYSQNPPYDHTPSISHKSDFGNIRTGKIGRASPNLSLIRQVLGNQPPARVLDVGASRGAFVKALLEWSPESEVLAVEPDSSVTDWWIDQEGDVTLWQTRIEDTNLGDKGFDLVYASHTIEHISDPRPVLARLREALSPDGWLFVEVPDMGAILGYPDGCEESFLDKHVTHFTRGTLTALLKVTGFEVYKLIRDGENLSVLARRGLVGFKVIPDPLTVSETRALLSRYQSTRARNLAQLPALAQKWNQLAQEKRVVAWGVGRLFSALVEAGLKTHRLVGLVDKNYPYLGFLMYHWVVCSPDRLPDIQPEVVMVCSRSALAEIWGQARGLLGETVEVIGYNEI